MLVCGVFLLEHPTTWLDLDHASINVQHVEFGQSTRSRRRRSWRQFCDAANSAVKALTSNPIGLKGRVDQDRPIIVLNPCIHIVTQHSPRRIVKPEQTKVSLRHLVTLCQAAITCWKSYLEFGEFILFHRSLLSDHINIGPILDDRSNLFSQLKR